MKNSFKLAVLALVISVSAAACGGSSSTDGADTTKTDSSTIVTDTVSKDTTIKTDSAKTDTTVKIETKETEVKKN